MLEAATEAGGSVEGMEVAKVVVAMAVAAMAAAVVAAAAMVMVMVMVSAMRKWRF